MVYGGGLRDETEGCDAGREVVDIVGKIISKGNILEGRREMIYCLIENHAKLERDERGREVVHRRVKGVA